MTAYVLVHGAWGGSYGWREFARLLRAQGHEVFVPSLTGLGEREHLSNPEVGLDTHIQDVVNAIDFEDLQDIVLVGHSYGGMVVTGVVDRMPDRIAHLVYEDAFLPRDGESCADLGGAGGAARFRERLIDGWKVPGTPTVPAGTPMTPEMTARERKRRPMPIKTLEDKVTLRRPLEDYAFTRTYVKAGGQPGQAAQRGAGAFWQAAEYTRNHPAWRYYELPCGHGVHRELPYAFLGIMLSLPDE
jgi:pimeloyl-ACP methyl ester carboxylesterase